MMTLHIVILDYANAGVVFGTVSQDFLDAWFGGDAENYVFADKENYGLGFKRDEIAWMCAPAFYIRGEL